MTELNGIKDVEHEFSFAASFYEEADEKPSATLNIRYYPETAITQDNVKSISDDLLAKADAAMKSSIIKILDAQQGVLTSWSGTKNQKINGMSALISGYKFFSPISGKVQIISKAIRILNLDKSFTLTISYKEDKQKILKPICERIISSLRI
jgi:hypothetical protein